MVNKSSPNSSYPLPGMRIRMSPKNRGGNMDILQQTDNLKSINRYLEHLRISDLSPLSISKYEHCVKAYESWLCYKPISALTAREFLDYLKSQGYSNASRAAYYHAIRPLLSFLEISFTYKVKREKKLPNPHNPEQIKSILDIVKKSGRKSKLANRDYLIILLLAYTGIRRAELLSLRSRDINFYSRNFKVLGKGSKERVIPIGNDTLYNLLLVHTKRLQPAELLFPIKPRRLHKIIKYYSMQAGINDIHPHSFRHFYATQLVEQGVSLKVIQGLLGHADITTTAIYIDCTTKHLEDAVAKLPDLT